jgi:hypothetical protein
MEVALRGLQLVQHIIDCLRKTVLFGWFGMDSAHGRASMNH